MVRTVDLLKDFDGPRDAWDYMHMLGEKGVPYEYVDENTAVVFDDESDHVMWLELAAEPGGFLEDRARRRELKSRINGMPNAETGGLLETIEEEMA